ncbi:hypothetical protein CCP1ISM_20006 [Azospirillaceae bacterium]
MEKRIIPVVRQIDIRNNKIKRIQPPIPRIRPQEALNLNPKKQTIVRQPVKIVQNNNPRSVNYIGKTNQKAIDNFTKDANYNKLLSIKGTGKGNVLVMIACGPSVNEVDFVPLKSAKNVKVMVINKPVESIWPTDYWAFCDQSQYERNRTAFDSYNGIIINSVGVRARKSNQILVRAKQGKGFNADITSGYFIGRSSVYANMQTALFMNFDKIYIFGIDMCAVNGKTHHYGNGFNPDVETNIRIQRFQYEAEHYSNAANLMSADDRKKFYFCSSYNTWPFVDKFNKLDHKVAVQEIIKVANQSI